MNHYKGFVRVKARLARNGEFLASPAFAGRCHRGDVSRSTTVGGAEVLQKGRGGVTGGGDGRRQEASAGPLLSGGGVTGGADRRRDNRCRGRRGKCRSHGRGRAPALPEEDRRDYWRGGHRYYRRGRQLAGPERASAGVTGGETAAVTGEARGAVIGRTGGVAEGVDAGITGGGDCRGDRRRRLLMHPLSPPATPALSSSGNACSRPLSQPLPSPLR